MEYSPEECRRLGESHFLLELMLAGDQLQECRDELEKVKREFNRARGDSDRTPPELFALQMRLEELEAKEAEFPGRTKQLGRYRELARGVA